MTSTITGRQLSELTSDNPRVKYRRAKSLVAIAHKDPGRLSPHATFFVRLLDNKNNILRWTAIDVIGGLAGVARRNRAEQFIEILVGALQDGKLIAANHAIAALADVARTRPHYNERVARELLDVEHYQYETEECRNIALGKVLEGLGTFSGTLKEKDEIRAFAARQTENGRPATRKKAEKLLKALKSSLS
jgi:hypothetical protein